MDKFQRGYDHANAAFDAANTGTQAQLAFAQANAAFITANASFIAANSAGVYANGAFVAANTADNKGTSAGIYANGAFAAANSAGSYANSAFAVANNSAGVNLTQNNSITAAFTAANSAGVYANGAFARANNSLNANTGGTVTGTVVIAGNLDVTGNLVISGNTITQNVSSLNIADPLIYLAANNYSSDVVEIGFAANYYDGATQRHTGLFREASNKEYYVFENYDKEPDANLIDINDASFRVATLNANLKSQSITLNNQNLQTYVDGAYNKANAAFVSANNIDGINTTQNNSITAAFTAANSAGAYANAAFAAANAANATDTTQNNSITAAFTTANSAGVYANGAFSLANGTATIANTDYTTITTTAGYYGNGATIASFTLAANGRITQANSTLIGISASQVTVGTLPVARGGTGASTFTTNGVLLGQGTSALTTASSSTEGHVLTINNSGVPTFAHLQGGTF
jgi:hypothetical protein